jgi:methyl-accepting chemotaxis protein
MVAVMLQTIKARLLAAFGALFLCTIAITSVGGFASFTANQGLETVYGDMEGVRELKVVADMYAVNIVDVSHKVRNGNMSWSEGISSIQQADQSIAKSWKAFKENHTSNDEASAVAEVERLTTAANQVKTDLLAAMQKQDKAALDKIVIERLYSTIDPVSEGVTKLIELEDKDAQKHFKATKAITHMANTVSFFSILVGAVVLVWSLWMVLAHIVKPLGTITKAMHELATGNTEITVPGRDRKDELGKLASALEVFLENATQRTKLEETARLEREREQMRQKQLEKLVLEFRGMIANVMTTLGREIASMRGASDNLAEAATTATSRAHSASEASEGASTNTQTVAAATEELGISIREIASQAQRASSIVEEATKAAKATDADVGSLAEAAQRIGQVVDMIRAIADQTNLLALNATIEAARAGEAGRGFAIVAQEVKSLAMQTAKATQEIADQVSSVQGSTEAAVLSIRAIGNRMEEINSLTTTIAAAVEEQEAATREIAHNVSLAADGSRLIANNASGVTEAAGQTQQEARRVQNTSDELTLVSKNLEEAVEAFLKDVATDLEERRKALRSKVDAPVEVHMASGKHHSKIHNVSPDGAQINFVPGLVPQGLIQIDFGQGLLPATVVWANSTVAGIAFKKPIPNIVELINGKIAA